MKQPKLSDLKIDKKGTRQLRAQMAKIKKVKITINLDSDLIASVKETAAETGAPYQTYINRILRETFSRKVTQEKRLNRLEKEVAQIKKQLVA